MYGAQARKDGKEREAPAYWQEHADAWLQGFDGVAMAGFGKTKTVKDEMEAEVDDAAVEPPAE
ncbi:hypothetical protein [Mesorhizobium sp. L103C131B0]|uniref:hypothetical protein n=1 Tax=Mesorhizobium sp. L103C131B0 TaxID=1287089 RepID=UPI0003D0051D|nr:hypothetical protein [Mesorhizobium sp. L103C131B0]ESZ51011.1 hypothetical protein X729_32650 [Mesorhizobium sp. L103C131B0]